MAEGIKKRTSFTANLKNGELKKIVLLLFFFYLEKSELLQFVLMSGEIVYFLIQIGVH